MHQVERDIFLGVKRPSVQITRKQLLTTNTIAGILEDIWRVEQRKGMGKNKDETIW